MKVSVLFPMRFQDPWRIQIAGWVWLRIKEDHPDWEICLGDNPGEFNRGTARNNAAVEATGDVFVIWDADTVCPDVFLRTAVESVVEGGWALPYGRYYNLSRKLTEHYVAQDPQVEIMRPAPEQVEHDLDSVGGIIAIHRDQFVAMGGYDEGYVGWGYEDNAFALKAERSAGLPRRVEDGFVCHLWHEAPEDQRFGQPNIEFNRARFRLAEREWGR